MPIVDVVRAWPRRHEVVRLTLPEGARVQDALLAAGWADDAEATGWAVYGLRVERDTPLNDGDRLEVLRPLQADPKDARRRRAATR